MLTFRSGVNILVAQYGGIFLPSGRRDHQHCPGSLRLPAGRVLFPPLKMLNRSYHIALTMASNPEGGTRKLAAIMFTDVRDFSKKMSENEIAAMEILKVHDGLVREVVLKFGGTIIKSLGDSFMVDFSSAVNAVHCAIEAQEQFWNYNQGKSEFDRIQIRVGIHLGDVITVGNDIYGDGVNIAARIESITEPTRICVSADIYNQVKNKMPIRAFSIGSIELKNIAEPVEVFELLIDSIPEFSEPSETAKLVQSRGRAELLSSQEEEEADRVEAAKRKVDEDRQREEAEKQARADARFVKAEEYFRAGELDKAEEEIHEIFKIVQMHYEAQMLVLQIEEQRARSEEENRRQRVREEKKRKEEERQQRIQQHVDHAIQYVEYRSVSRSPECAPGSVRHRPEQPAGQGPRRADPLR